MDTQVRILLVCDNKDLKNQIISYINRNDASLRAISTREIKTEIDRISPHIVLLADYDHAMDIEVVQYIQHEISDSFEPVFFYITNLQNFTLLRELIREGVNDYFVLPEELPSLKERLERVMYVVKERIKYQTEALATGQTQPFKKGKGQIHAFYSGKGGVGCSLLSTLYAQTIKFESTAEVLFIDLNIQYGGAETFLGIEKIRSYAELLPVMDELNENHIRNVAVKEPNSKLDLLLSPQDAEVAERMTEDHIIRLLRTCRRAYDMVIIDLPAHMDSKTFTALSESELIYYVMTLDTPSITGFKRVQDLFKRLRMDTNGRLQVLINRLEKSNELVPSDVNEFITYPIRKIWMIEMAHKRVWYKETDVIKPNPFFFLLLHHT
ncbi:AAA family ATPase [Ornithinibacillus gellani]|uniref:AAA family ATPase n=1 Tax=Ornithinibacillus gellani TaxID=2293253 RepID=UPI000F4A200D|nr:AAA family ATPase [Ornithinibacillus gellani]TQS76386.1 AAA family ATPase [Ornithinibacillus gellani]